MHMGQFSMTISTVAGSVLGDNQHITGMVYPTEEWERKQDLRELSKNLFSMAKAESLFAIGENVLVWELPPVLLKAVGSLTIYTFLAEGSLMAGFMRRKLREKFDTGKQRTEAERLRALLSQKLAQTVARNPTRADFLERFQKLIDGYNSGSQNIEAFFNALIRLAEELSEDEQETIREGLTEEEKALFDILTKPAPELAEKEREQVKVVARSLLQTLKDEKLVLGWTKEEQARGAVRQVIEVTLDHGLPDAYDEETFYRKCDGLYRHVFDAYQRGPEGIYTTG